jgi:circadian clock protein KaiB
MTTRKPKTAGGRAGMWDFSLYVAGRKPRSMAAYDNLRRICEEHLPGRYTITVIDVQKHPARAREADIAALPTVIRKLPLPLRHVVGDLSRTDDVLLSLGYSREGDT